MYKITYNCFVSGGDSKNVDTKDKIKQSCPFLRLSMLRVLLVGMLYEFGFWLTKLSAVDCGVKLRWRMVLLRRRKQGRHYNVH